MKIIDMHTHLGFAEADGKIGERLNKAGIYGACVFSRRPDINGMSFENRLSEVLDFTQKDKERLFPVMWIDPYEEDILGKIDVAVEKNIVGFKMICSGFYVYEEKVIEVLKYIASRNKPVFFHTGILWDGKDSSKFNRPANWEALIGIKGLRFSMGHCSWPWIDECIAAYGKFLNAYGSGEAAEMFLDITPGTPEIYREELLTKLFTIGYDVGNNILFGTDCLAEDYNCDWAKKWLDKDRKIMDKLGVAKRVRENLYYNNFMRFIGHNENSVTHLSPTTDNANAWSPFCDEMSGLLETWYKKLNFPEVYDREFHTALENLRISDAITVEDYDVSESNGKRNLLSYLFFCERLKKRYEERGIPSEVLYDTLSDIVIWTDVWSDLKNELYLGEIEWLKRHLGMRLFKLGRLQFCMAGAEQDIPSENISKGDNVIEIHIPATGALTKEECITSIEYAKEFFARYFPEFDYMCFTCHSWLLDESLKDLLDEKSNIIRFQELFNIIHKEKSDAIIRYVFKWNTTRNTLKDAHCSSAFAEKIKKHIADGKDFHEVLGVLKK